MQTPDIFCDAHIQQFCTRTAKNFESYQFLHEWVAKDISDRLDVITRDFSSVLLSGHHTADFFKDRFQKAVVIHDASPEKLAGHAGQFDLIVSMGEMHHANDLPGQLVQMRRALKPDGVIISAFAGGKTLQELRVSLMHAEISVLGGASPRVFPFADTQQMAALMQRAGFALPVVDSESLVVSYRDMFHLMDDIRGMGESNVLVNRYKALTPSRVFAAAADYYHKNFQEEDGRVKASFEFIFLIGWAPHESQQKPAKRGSGKVSLTEIL